MRFDRENWSLSFPPVRILSFSVRRHRDVQSGVMVERVLDHDALFGLSRLRKASLAGQDAKRLATQPGLAPFCEGHSLDAFRFYLAASLPLPTPSSTHGGTPAPQVLVG